MSDDDNPYRSPGEVGLAAEVPRRPGGNFRPGNTRAMVAILFLAIAVFGRVFEAGSTLQQIRLLNSVAHGVQISRAEALQSDNRLKAAALFALAAYGASGIAFIVWLYRASANLKPLGIRSPGFSPGWAIGAWFIPIGCLIIPYQIVEEIWNGSDPGNVGSKYAKRASGLAWVRLWWAFYLLTILVSIAVRFSGGEKTLDAMIGISWLVVVNDVLMVVAGALAIHVVYRVKANQTARHQALMELEANAPLPAVNRALRSTEAAAKPSELPGEVDPLAWMDKLQ